MCVQLLTVNLFELSTWKMDQPAEDGGAAADAGCLTPSEFLVVFRNCTDLWRRLTRKCACCLSKL